MNRDVGEVLEDLRDVDPVVVGGIVSLIVVVVLSIFVFPLFLNNRQERAALQEELLTRSDALEQALEIQSARPEQLRERVAELRSELNAVLQDFPSTEEVSEEVARYYEYASSAGVRLIRRESLLLPPAEQDTPGYEIQRFVLEAQGPAADLMRFLAQVGSPPYPTFILHNINITQNDPAVAEADLTVYSSDLEVGSPLPENETEGTPVPEGQEGDRIQEFEMLMRRAVAQENWAEAISYGQRILRLEAGNENAQETLYQAYVSWGDELAAEGNVVQARQQYENALELRPDGEEALEGLRALEDQGPNDAARADVPSGQGRAEGASG